MRRSARYRGPDVRDPEQRRAAFAGLTQRQNQERLEERPRVFLPFYDIAQVKDVKR
jgi:hypothetical protein